jgi:hypothetical protein
MLQVTKDKAVKLFNSIPRKQVGIVRATSPKKSLVTIITKKDKQVLRICDGAYWA